MDESGRQLQEANAVLDAAYRHVRQVRHELLELSRVSNARVGPASTQFLMNPGHEAVVLAESRDMSADLTAQSVPSLNPLRRFGSTASNRPPQDDSATLIGRRIAAREASRNSTQSSPTGGLQRQQWSEQETHNNENGRRDSGRPDFSPNDPASASETVTSRLDFRNRFEPANPSSPHRRTQSPRRPGNHSSRSSSILSSILNLSRRLSLLTDVSLRNFSSPPSTIFQPSSFDEPVVQSDSPSETSVNINSTAEGPRRYIIRRRLNSVGEEVVRQIHLDWDDEGSLPVLPSSEEQVQQDSIQRSFRPDILHAPRLANDVPFFAGPSTRGRAWARLNADGDEIPLDEEEELERLRTEYRIRARNRVRRQVSDRAAQEGPIYSDMPFSESPVDDTVPLPDVSPRLQYDHGSVGDSIASVHEGMLAHESSWSESGPFRPSALPISLSEMISTPPDSSYARERVIPVSEYAGLACR